MNNIRNFEHFSDQEIITKILLGENKLYELLIRRNNPYLYKIGRMYNYNHHDTEDLMQDTFIKAFYNLGNFENKSSFKTWLTKIMLNNCYHKKQKHSYLKETSVESLQEEKLPFFQSQINLEKSIMNKELGYVLESALSMMPEENRMVFAMRELNGLSTLETAEILNMTEANVKVKLSRTKALLRTEIEKIYSPNEIYEFNLVYCDKMVENVLNKISNDRIK